MSSDSGAYLQLQLERNTDDTSLSPCMFVGGNKRHLVLNEMQLRANPQKALTV
jgi:hypothetical protein